MKTKKDVLEILEEGFIDSKQKAIHQKNVVEIKTGNIDVTWIKLLDMLHETLKRSKPTDEEYKTYAIEHSKTIAILESYKAKKNQPLWFLI